jgi:hypothetical protein
MMPISNREERTMDRKTVERASNTYRKASSALTDWCIANGFGNVRFNDLAAALADNMQGLGLYGADRTAAIALDQAESAAVQAGKAWRDDRGHVQLYSTSDLRKFASRKRKSA